jgi:hypothetical protein
MMGLRVRVVRVVLGVTFGVFLSRIGLGGCGPMGGCPEVTPPAPGQFVVVDAANADVVGATAVISSFEGIRRLLTVQYESDEVERQVIYMW